VAALSRDLELLGELVEEVALALVEELGLSGGSEPVTRLANIAAALELSAGRCFEVEQALYPVVVALNYPAAPVTDIVDAHDGHEG